VLLIFKSFPGMGFGEEIEIGFSQKFLNALQVEVFHQRATGVHETTLAVFDVEVVGNIPEKKGEEVSGVLEFLTGFFFLLEMEIRTRKEADGSRDEKEIVERHPQHPD
jgi:high-affinity Fe2+/Pb2+ permease